MAVLSRKRLLRQCITGVAGVAGVLVAAVSLPSVLSQQHPPRLELQLMDGRDGRPTEVRVLLRDPGDIHAFELVGSTDPGTTIDAAAGLNTTDEGVEDLSISETTGRAVLAAAALRPLGRGSVVELGRMYVTPSSASTAVRFGAAKFVDGRGRRITVAGADRLVEVGDGRSPSPTLPWSAPGAARAGGKLERDVDGDGRIDRRDATEVLLDFQRARLSAAPCGAGARAADLDGNGCVDTADVLTAKRYLADHPIPAAAVEPSSWTVTDAGDAGDSDIGNGVCRTVAGVCTLRAAIQEANAADGCRQDLVRHPRLGCPTDLAHEAPARPRRRHRRDHHRRLHATGGRSQHRPGHRQRRAEDRGRGHGRDG